MWDMCFSKIKKHPLIFIVGIALFTRLLFWIFFPLSFPTEMFSVYDFAAESFASKEGFALLKHIQPGWPSVLGVLYSVFGDSAVVMFSFQTLLSILLVVGVYLLASEVYENKMIALTVGVIASVWPFFILVMLGYAGTNNLLFTTLLLFGVYYFIHMIKSRRLYSAILSGVLFAAAALTDVVGLYLSVFLVITAAVYTQWIDEDSFIPRRLYIAFLCIFVILVGMWTYRNHVVITANQVNKQANKQFPEVVRESAPDIIPFVAKQRERDITQKNFWKRLTKTKASQAGKELYDMFAFPYQLRYLTDGGVTTSYKKALSDVLRGRPLPPSINVSVLISKIILVLLHWTLLFFGIWGVWKSRSDVLGVITFALLGYMIAVVMAVAVTSPVASVISSNAYFLFPVTPLLLVLAVRQVYDMVELTHHG